MKKNKDLFKVSEKVAKELKIRPLRVRMCSGPVNQQILYIFDYALQKYNKNKLSINEVIAGYYNLFTKKGYPIRDRASITQQLCGLSNMFGKASPLINTERGIYTINKRSKIWQERSMKY